MDKEPNIHDPEIQKQYEEERGRKATRMNLIIPQTIIENFINNYKRKTQTFFQEAMLALISGIYIISVELSEIDITLDNIDTGILKSF